MSTASPRLSASLENYSHDYSRHGSTVRRRLGRRAVVATLAIVALVLDTWRWSGCCGHGPWRCLHPAVPTWSGAPSPPCPQLWQVRSDRRTICLPRTSTALLAWYAYWSGIARIWSPNAPERSTGCVGTCTSWTGRWPPRLPAAGTADADRTAATSRRCGGVAPCRPGQATVCSDQSHRRRAASGSRACGATPDRVPGPCGAAGWQSSK